MTTFSTVFQQVESLYVGYFGRAGDPNGVNYWVSQISTGATTLAKAAASFSTSAEATAKYPFLLNPFISDPGVFVDQVYQNLFNHLADAAGKAYWVGQINANLGNAQVIGQMILNIISGAPAGSADNQTIINKVDVAGDFTTKASNAGTTWGPGPQAQSASEISATNDTAASVTAQKAATDAYIASAPGPQQNFTLGIDNLTSGALNANFNAPLIFNAPAGALTSSLQVGDSAVDTAPLTGPGLSNGGTFTAVLNATTGPTVNLVTLKGIPSHTVTNVGGVATGYNGDITGLVTFNNLQSGIGGITIGVAGNGIDKGGVAGTTTTGATLLSTVNVNSITGGATTIWVNTAALAGAADALAININGVFGVAGTPNTVSVKNDTAAAATADNAYESITVNAAAATFLALSDAGSGTLSTTKITVNGAGATSLFGNVGENFSKLTTIDAAAQTGGVTITGANTGATGLLTANTVLSSFKGGTGADSIDLSSMTAAQLSAITAGNLDGGTGTSRDTLRLSAAQAGTTTSVNNSNFEILDVLGAFTMDFSKFGAGIDTINFFAAQTAANTFNNLISGLTFNINFHAGFADTFNAAAGTGLADSITVNLPTGAAAIGLHTTTGFEVVNTSLISFPAAVAWAGLNATPTAGGAVVHNLIDNQTGGTLTIAAENVGTGGSLVLTGSATASNIAFTAAPVLGTLNATGWGTGLAATAAGITYGSFATSAHSFSGSAGADTFLGSTFADTVSGNAGNDIIVNLATGKGGVGVNDIIATGTGVDQVTIRGSVASGALPALYNTVTVITDFTPGTGAVGTTDFVTLSTEKDNYASVTKDFNNEATATAQGAWAVQSVTSANGDIAALAAGMPNQLIKLTTGVAAGATFQATFNAAIGTTTITTTKDKSYYFTLYDTTNGKMDIGIVTDTANTKINSGDTVSLVGSVNISAADYALITTNHFSTIAA